MCRFVLAIGKVCHAALYHSTQEQLVTREGRLVSCTASCGWVAVYYLPGELGDIQMAILFGLKQFLYFFFDIRICSTGQVWENELVLINVLKDGDDLGILSWRLSSI